MSNTPYFNEYIKVDAIRKLYVGSEYITNQNPYCYPDKIRVTRVTSDTLLIVVYEYIGTASPWTDDQYCKRLSSFEKHLQDGTLTRCN